MLVSPVQQDQFVTVKTVATYFSISAKTVQRLTNAHVIPVFRICGMPRYRLLEVEAALRDRGLGR